jgi:Fic family protein
VYIYEHKDWPNFIWDKILILEKLASIQYSHGQLIGKMESIGLFKQKESALETISQDIIKSSEIEGDLLDEIQVRSSVARRIGISISTTKKPSPRIDSISQMMLDATQNFHLPLSQKRLFDWHKLLFKNSSSKIIIGDWRDDKLGPMQVISGVIGRLNVNFEAPHAYSIQNEINKFIDWYNNALNIDYFLKAAIAHLWFVTLHPFDDGNGRIARSLTDMIFAKAENSSNRFFSLSSQIMIQRKEYYNILEATQKGKLDITNWIIWFLDCLDRAIKNSDNILFDVLKKTKIWQKYSEIELSSRQIRLINNALDKQICYITSSAWAKIAKCSQDTAHRDIVDLVEKNILIPSSSKGRSTSYKLCT